jgi:hypothetical protein
MLMSRPVFVKILHLAFARRKIMTNIMPTHVKITIEPGIRELFLKYWQEVKQMTTNLYIGDHVFNLESHFVFSPHVKSRDITRILKSCDIL